MKGETGVLAKHYRVPDGPRIQVVNATMPRPAQRGMAIILSLGTIQEPITLNRKAAS